MPLANSHTRYSPLNKQTRLRTGVVSTVSEPSETGGMFDNGFIPDFAVITRGLAEGHDRWCDDQFVDAVGKQLSANSRGIKSRFTHGSLSGDGLADTLGRSTFVRQTHDQVVGTLHFGKMANEEYRRQLLAGAIDQPEDFGSSIVFKNNEEAMVAHAIKHGAEMKEDPYIGEYLDTEDFRSPDPKNVNNLLHFQLSKLERVDIVGDPATNDGLYAFDDKFAQYQALARVALGERLPENELAPVAAAIGVKDPAQIHEFAKRTILENADTILELINTHRPKQAGAEPPLGVLDPPSEKEPADEKPRTNFNRYLLM